MKKRLMAIALTAILSTAMITGCAGSNKIDTDELTIEGYKGIEIDEIEKPGDVTDEDVENSINTTLGEHKTSKEITDRAVKEGDVINLDYAGKVDGEAFEGGTAEGASLEIGSGNFIEGFEDSTIGRKIGDTYDWEGKFPDEYQNNPDLAGKDCVFTITINGITEQELPELNDDFVKTVSEKSKTVEEYKKEVKENLEKSNKDSYENQVMSAVWNAVLDKTEIKKYDEDKIKEDVESYIEQYKSMAESNNMTYEELIEYYGSESQEAFEDSLEENAKSSLKSEMVTDAICEKEKLEPTEDEYNGYYKKLATANGYDSVDALKEAYDEDQIKSVARNYAVVEWLTDNSVQVKAD